MNNYEKILGIKFTSYKLAFYNIASKIKNKRKSTIDYIYRQGLNMNDKITINDFISKIISPLNIDNEIGMNIFRALNPENGLIKVEDFVLVIDSYRSDSFPNMLKEEDKSINIKNNQYNNDYKLTDNKIFWINKFCNLLNSIDITEKMCFDSAKDDVTQNEINVDILKRKLKLMLPKNRTSAIELNNIADAFDLHYTKKISFDEYMGMIKTAKSDDKYNLLTKYKENTFPLIDSINTNTKDLPFRTNMGFYKNNNKNKMIIKSVNKEEEKNNNKDDNITDSNIKEINDLENILEEAKQKENTNYINLFNDDKEIVPEDIKSFLKDLDVFESGEWSLIELFEEYDIPEDKAKTSCIEFYKVLENKFCPTIEKEKLSYIINTLDSDEDGCISYIDLLLFLRRNLHYSSSKIGWKEVTRRIIMDYKQSPETFINNNLTIVENVHNEISFASFIKLLSGTFAIPPNISKTMYDDLQGLIATHKITRPDIIDTINRQIEYFQNKKKSVNADTQNLDDCNYLKSINKRNQSYYNPLSLLDKKYYEQEMKHFVTLLQKAFVQTKSSNISEELSNNLQCFVNLPNEVKLSQFRELFIKPLSMDYAIGISTFQIAKSLNVIPMKNPQEKVLTTVDSQNIYNILLSFINYEEVEFDPRTLIFFIENGKYPSIKSCFETLTYNYKGVTSIELLRHMEMFYPKVNRILLAQLIKVIDSKCVGIISYYSLCNFIYMYSIKEDNMYSSTLMLYYIASILDKKRYITEDYLRNNIVTNDNKNLHVSLDSHNRFFINIIKFDEKQSENLFMYLSNVKKTGKYSLQKLICLINQIRTRKSYGNGKSFFNPRIGQTESKKLSELLNLLNRNIPLCDVFHKLSINKTNLGISIIELDRTIKQSYSTTLDIDKNLLIKLYKAIDMNNTGMLNYKKFYTFIKSHINDDYKGCYLLHLKYIAHKIYLDFNGKWSQYLAYKRLVSNKYLNQVIFELIFKKEEFFNDTNLCNEAFNFLKEKNAANSNLLYVQNYIEFMKQLVDDNIEDNTNKEDSEDEFDEIESEILVKNTIKKYEKDGGQFISLFDEIKFNTDVNSFGKIHWKNIKKILEEIYAFDDIIIKAFKQYFCRLTNLFDLFKLTDTCQDVSVYRIEIEVIKNKVENTINTNKTETEFFGYYSINPITGLRAPKFVEFVKLIFGLSSYESCIMFTKLMNLYENPNHNQLKVSLHFLIEYLNLCDMFVNDDKFKKLCKKQNKYL